MPLFGAHMSVAGGCPNAVRRRASTSCDTVQLFTKNANQWNARPFTDEEVRLFRKALHESGLRFATAHDSYLINLASPDEALYRRSVEAFVVEVQRAEQLGLAYLVMHPGAHVDSGEEAGLERVARALDEVHARCPDFRVRVLLETTAGQGTTLGHRFEHLAASWRRSRRPTGSASASTPATSSRPATPWRRARSTRPRWPTFDRIVGLEKLRVFHVNDSLKPLGSRVDRHAHIGRGCLGLEPFRLLVNDPRFATGR